METTMTYSTPALLPATRLRMSTGAFAGAAHVGSRGADVLTCEQGTAAPAFGYTPAIVDVVRMDKDDVPGIRSWSPPV